MALTSEQKKAVASWIAAGDNLSAVQQKLTAEFKISMTYMDVRFLVDDLNLQIKDPVSAKKTEIPEKAEEADESSTEKKSFLDKMKEKVGLGADDDSKEPEVAEALEDEEAALEDDKAPGGNAVTVAVDKITLIPGALASGSVTFSDGVVGKWIVDQYGRPGFTEISKPGYRPSPIDAQAFMTKLAKALQKQGY
jgi:hypothetical protein